MANVTRRIGLSLGADICWPICYEELIKRLDLVIDWQGDQVGIEVDRVTIEPFDHLPEATGQITLSPCRFHGRHGHRP